MNDMVYPPGCKPISDDLGSDELLRRLKVLAHTFQGFGQDANESYNSYIPLSLYLAEEQFLTHNSKDVQLLIACCIADIMRVYAPEAPYKDPIKIREIFEFIIKQLNGLKDPKDPAFKRYFYLLENLSFVKSFNMCFELEDNQEIFCSLFSLFFRIVSDDHSAKVKSYMLEILCPLISESDNVSTDLLDIILINICEPYKSSKKNAYQLAKELILRTQDTLQQYIKLFCNQVLVTDNLDKNYSIAKKIYDLIYELNVLSPQILYSSLPQIEVKLKSSNHGDREKAVALIARMFSEPQSDLSTKYPHLWKIFLARFNDISIPIRLKCVQISMHFLVNHENTIKDITECLRQRQHDLDESIRHQVVTSIVETAKRSYNVVASSPDLIEFVRERTLDKKYKIRKEALNGLAFIYKKYLMDPHNVEVHEPSMEMIKNKILHGYYMPTIEDRILVERLLITCLVPYTQETEPRMKSLYHLLGSIDDNATKAFIELQKNQMKIRKLVGDWVKLHRNSAENNKPQVKIEINLKSQQISKTMPDPVKSLEYLTKFSQQMKSDPYTLRAMDALLKKDLSCRECAENMSCILKKLGQPMQTNIYYNVVKMVLERMSSVMVDKESIGVLISLIEECIKINRTVIKEVRIKADIAGVRGLQLLTVLSFCFAAYFQHEPILQHLLTLLAYSETEYEYVVSYVLKIFTHLGKYVPLSKNYPEIFEQLVTICCELCKTGTPKQAKQAVRCVYVNAINREDPEKENTTAMNMFNELVEFLKIGLNPENENFRTAIVCMGHIAFHMPNKYTLTMKNFVARKFVKELLILKVPEDRGDLPEGEWCKEEELPEITLCKLEAMKAMARWLTGLKTDVTAAEKTFRMLSAIIERGGDLLQDNILSTAEKSWIRLTAANAILKICEQKGVGDQIVAEQYFDLSRMMVDHVPEVRESFAKKLHKGLNKGIPHRCLPISFMGFYSLAGLEKDKRISKHLHDFMEIDVNRRRDYITLAKVKSNCTLLLPDNMLVYTALVLAHSNIFKDFCSKKTLNDLERCLCPVIDALMSDKKGFSYNLNKNTLESMKIHKDIHDSDDSNEYSVKIWTICDLAMHILNTKTKVCDSNEAQSVLNADPPLVHGQLKSTNILVDDSWNAKLADFGTRRVAEAVGFDRSRMNSIDERSALLRWTAPELLKLGEERVMKGAFPSDSASPQAVDIFSFGLIMWELTTGELPYSDMHSNAEISEYVLTGRRPIMKPGQCNIKWAELMARCWSHSPSRRPSAAEIVSSLESISKADAIAQSAKKETRVVNSNRADYRFAEKPRSRSKGSSKFKSNVRVVV